MPWTPPHPRTQRSGLLALLLPLLVGCGSIISGTTDNVAISSTPTGAEVLIYKQHGAKMFQGKTPAVAKLKRKDEYVVTVRVPGYEDAKLNLNGEFNSWSLLNILLLPPIGTLIGGGYDLFSGGFWRLDPDEIIVTLSATPSPSPAAPTVAPLDGGAPIVVPHAAPQAIVPVRLPRTSEERSRAQLSVVVLRKDGDRITPWMTVPLVPLPESSLGIDSHPTAN